MEIIPNTGNYLLRIMKSNLDSWFKIINEEEPSAENSSKNDNNLDLLFSTENGPQQPVEENLDLQKSGLEGLEDLF